jgi:hypothetical protein
VRSLNLRERRGGARRREPSRRFRVEDCNKGPDPCRIVCLLQIRIFSWPPLSAFLRPPSTQLLPPPSMSSAPGWNLTVKGVVIRGPLREGFDTILTNEAVQFLAELHRKFEHTSDATTATRARSSGQYHGSIAHVPFSAVLLPVVAPC